MSRKTVFFDIDGTVMDEFGFIPDSARRAIASARERGVLCIINTGRPFTHIEPFVLELGFDGAICSCGQHLVMDGRSVFRMAVDAGLCGRIVRLAADCRLDAYYEAEEGMRCHLTHAPNIGMKMYMDRMAERGFQVDLDPREAGYKFDKFCIWAHPDSRLEDFVSFAEEHYDLIFRGGGMYECVLRGCSKATGIEAFRAAMDIDLADCYAIGDSANDLPMLRCVPHSIAMAEANDEVKAQVEYVTAGLHEDGLALAMEYYGLC